MFFLRNKLFIIKKYIFVSYKILTIRTMRTLKYILSILIYCVSLSVMARTYNGTPHRFLQPDSSSVTVYLYGTDLYIDAESEDHYTLIRDENSGYVCYALLSSDSCHYASTGIVYKGGETPQTVKSILKPRIRLSKVGRETIIKQKKAKLGGEPQATLKAANVETATTLPDTIYGVCVLIDFSDVKSDVSRDQIEVFLNSDNETVFGNAMSIKRYFSWISGGKLTYINYVPAKFYTAPNTKEYYSPKSATDYTTDRIYPIVEAALKSYRKEIDGFDLSDLTLRSNSRSLYAINILYAGHCDNEWATGLWPHQSSYPFNILGSRFVYHPYQMTDIDTELSMGTFVHENGHLVCDWPDYYSYDDHHDNNAEDYNVADAFWISNEKNPPYPNAWALDNMGWLTNKIDITDIHDGRIITLKQECGSAAVYNGSGTGKNERYYIEVRDKQFKTWSNRDKGIYIWHYNSKGDNCYEGHPELLDCRPATSNNPFWTSTNGPKVFDDNSKPSAKWVDGSNSGLYLWDFSPYSTTMTFRCGEKIEIPEFLTQELIKGGVDNEYYDSIVVQGGEAPYFYSIKEGSLPEGLQLSQTGVISGIPTEEGVYNIEILLSDMEGNNVTKEFSIEIATSTPYEDVITIPGKIEMEKFDNGGDNVAYYDVDERNEGTSIREDNANVYIQAFRSSVGYSIMQTTPGEWTQYSVKVEKSGVYRVTFRHSTTNDAKVSIFKDGENVGSVSLRGVLGAQGTSNSRGYTTSSSTVTLNKGEYKLKFVFESSTNVNTKLYTDYVNFELEEEFTDVFDFSHMCELNTCGKDFTINSDCWKMAEVYSIDGTLIESIDLTSQSSFGSYYPDGIYVIKLYSDNTCETRKIIKLK